MSEPLSVLVIDDDAVVLRAVSETLKRAGHRTIAVSDPVEGIETARDASIDVVVCDVRMPHLSGLELLREVKQARPEVEVILMTGHGTIETAIEAVRAGAYDFLLKPFEHIDLLTHAVARAAERQRLKRRASHLEEELATRERFQGMVGQSAPMLAVYKMVESVGPTTATVLIEGESGTGKELVARALHLQSLRKSRPFIAVNCSALPETLIDSELFGHLKGAFTGATDHRRGLFEAANGGTLFLDEIGDIPPATQVRLLRALQEGEIKRVGANEVVKVDVRIIAATNVALEQARREKRFRDDLYYRLSVIPIRLPPLRERPEDIPLLAQHFLHKSADRMGKKVTSFAPETLDRLVRYSWRGNVRELENAIERLVVLSPGPVIEPDLLPDHIRAASRPEGADVDGASSALLRMPFAQAKALSVSAFERRYLTAALARSGGNVSAAALAAGMDRSNFRRLLKENGITPRGSEAGSDPSSES
jgi:DNA-binding NtrC family response regulator